MIYFNKASITPLEKKYLVDALHNSKLSGDGKYTFQVYEQFKKRFGIENMLLTTSGTTALEMASLLINLEPGDEVIVPSLLFVNGKCIFIKTGKASILRYSSRYYEYG